jgi:hypothetical protein
MYPDPACQLIMSSPAELQIRGYESSIDHAMFGRKQRLNFHLFVVAVTHYNDVVSPLAAKYGVVQLRMPPLGDPTYRSSVLTPPSAAFSPLENSNISPNLNLTFMILHSFSSWPKGRSATTDSLTRKVESWSSKILWPRDLESLGLWGTLGTTWRSICCISSWSSLPVLP